MPKTASVKKIIFVDLDDWGAPAVRGGLCRNWSIQVPEGVLSSGDDFCLAVNRDVLDVMDIEEVDGFQGLKSSDFLSHYRIFVIPAERESVGLRRKNGDETLQISVGEFFNGGVSP